MNNYLEFTATKVDEGESLDAFLKTHGELSGRFIKKASKEKRIEVNGKATRKGYEIKEGDKIRISLDRDETQDIAPEDIKIDVVYEDEYILVANKSPYMVVHPTKSHPTGTLANGIVGHFRRNGEKGIVRLVNRLDMDTSGLVMVAKNQFSHMKLSEYMQEDKIKKEYIAITKGKIENSEGTINQPIGRPTEDSIKRAVMEGGQDSITHYKVTQKLKEDFNIVELRLETGRTHQIRVHLSYIGSPIVGDHLYGYVDEKLIKRQALHAYRLEFPHPMSGELVKVEAPLPEDMKKLIENI